MVIICIQIHLKFLKKAIKLLLEFLVFCMICLSGNITLNLFYVIKREIEYNSFSLNNCKSSKIRIAQGFIPNEITFLKCQLHR